MLSSKKIKEYLKEQKKKSLDELANDIAVLVHKAERTKKYTDYRDAVINIDYLYTKLHQKITCEGDSKLSLR